MMPGARILSKNAYKIVPISITPNETAYTMIPHISKPNLNTYKIVPISITIVKNAYNIIPTLIIPNTKVKQKLAISVHCTSKQQPV